MADFESKAAELRAAGIRIAAASVDTGDNARKIAEELRLSYSVGYGLTAEEVSAATGAFYDADKKYLHATGFILKPDGMVAGAVYSTGPIGRYTAADVLALVTALSKKA